MVRELRRILAVLLVLFLLVILHSKKHDYTTIEGDGLAATPWQRWKRWPNFVTPTRAAKIRHCDGTRCVRRPLDPPVDGSAVGTVDGSAVGTVDGTVDSPPVECPAYFDWIDRDLKVWEENGGISRWNLDRAKRRAAFRVVIMAGKLYVEPYYSCHHGRVLFNVWGLLMLLERFPGQVNDVEFLFNCADRPQVLPAWWSSRGPLFGYSTLTGNRSLDIPFPDWSFWGWPEKGISNWEKESAEIIQEAETRKWKDRERSAYWKGDVSSSTARENLLKCNSSRSSRIQIYQQDWKSESRSGFTNSQLSKQCNHRYKIYAEGNAWSVSYKYILACGSTVFSIDQEYQDFFSRALKAWVHYVPIPQMQPDMCDTMEGFINLINSKPQEGERVGRQAQEFIQRDLSMDRVYDYMLHLLNGYAKLQRFKPRIPTKAKRLCPETVRCLASPQERKFLDNVPRPAPAKPCSMRNTLNTNASL